MSFEINGVPVLANVETFSANFLVGDAIYAADNETADRPNYETTRSSTLTDGELALDVLRMHSGAYLEFDAFQGTVSGYTSGGFTDSPTPARVSTIDKFSFSDDSNATDVGVLDQARLGVVGQSSSTHGYSSGGNIVASPAPVSVNKIDKFPFATDAGAADVGILTEERYYVAGQSSTESGYTSGGFAPPYSNVIDKFPFASDADASDVGDLNQARSESIGQSSDIHGYSSGGYASSTYVKTIDKFPFATDTNASGVGELFQARGLAAGQSSSTNGYTSGGVTPTIVNTIDKFPFAADNDATDIANLDETRYGAAGQSSILSGYSSGGAAPPVPASPTTKIDKFPFSSDIDATDVGDLTQARQDVAGQQV